MDDKQLLELAAKAAGIGGMHYPKGGWLINGSFDVWNPLTDDGDALRLAVRLRMRLEQAKSYSVAYAGTACAHQCTERVVIDPYAATRRAIVRAAANLGKAMGDGE